MLCKAAIISAAGPCALGFVSLCNLPSESVLLSPRNRSQSSAAPKTRENRSRGVAVGAGPVPPSEQLGTLNKRGAFVVLFPPMRGSLRTFSQLGGEVASVLSALKLPSSGRPPGVTLRLRGRRTASKTARESAKACLVRAASLAPACLRQSWLPCKSFRSCQAAAKPLRSGRKFLLFAAVWEEERLFQPPLLLPVLRSLHACAQSLLLYLIFVVTSKHLYSRGGIGRTCWHSPG